MLLLHPEKWDLGNVTVEIPFPDGSRVQFTARLYGVTREDSGPVALASVTKDGGDDPDVTNGAAIRASARITETAEAGYEVVVIRGGQGVGKVTKPGLSVSVGEPAITPVPKSMIRQAVQEALSGDGGLAGSRGVEITISVPKGEELAKKTLNARLGILGGISILGTSGIVRPLSSEAWTSTITASMDVAKALGIAEIVLSVGRVSEKAHMKRYAFAEEAYVMMGDYVEFSLTDARKYAFKKVHVSAQWAKMLKILMSTPQTHVRHGAINLRKGVERLNELGIAVPRDRDFNTAREIYDYLVVTYGLSLPMFRKVCIAAKRYAEGLTAGIPVIAHLVSYEGDILVDSE
jgi:cobalt-precorrin-5B (C1)-methyltransferase